MAIMSLSLIPSFHNLTLSFLGLSNGWFVRLVFPKNQLVISSIFLLFFCSLLNLFLLECVLFPFLLALGLFCTSFLVS